MENEFWSRLIESLLLKFLPVIFVMVTALLYAWLRKTWAEFKAKKPDLARVLEEAATLAVRAAEQAGAAELIYDKKEYALSVAERFLAAKGLRIDLDLIDDAVEAAVFEEINRYKERSPVAASALTLPDWFTEDALARLEELAKPADNGEKANE